MVIPDHVFSAACILVLDSLGCQIGGMQTEPARRLLRVVSGLGGAAEAEVPGAFVKLPVANAAWVGGYTANVLDFDDTFDVGVIGHPAAAVVPPALAVAEWHGLSLMQALRAIVVGYEVGLRIGRAMKPSPERYKSVYGFSTWQIFGGVAAVANLMRLDLERTIDAIGLAGVEAPVPSLRKLGSGDKGKGWARGISWLKNNYGRSTFAAVTSCQLAEVGFTGSSTILDGDDGFWVMAGSDSMNAASAMDGLGEEWLLPMTGIKPYSCCRAVHPSLDAIAELRRRGPFDANSIETVTITTAHEYALGLTGPAPANIIDSQFHMPYLVALELLGKSSANGLDEADLKSSAVAAMIGRIELRGDDVMECEHFAGQGYPTRVNICLVDGRTLEQTARNPKGSPGGPAFGEDAVKAKFRSLVSRVSGEQAAEKLLGDILGASTRLVSDMWHDFNAYGDPESGIRSGHSAH